MGKGTDLRDRAGLGDHLRDGVSRRAPAAEPVTFRGRVDEDEDELPFFAELESSLRCEPGSIWSVVGPAGTGKSLLARWAAARWSRRFLASPDDEPAVLWVDPSGVRAAHEAACGDGIRALAIATDLPRASRELAVALLRTHPVIAVFDEDDATLDAESFCDDVTAFGANVRVLHTARRRALPGRLARLGGWERDEALLAAHRLAGAEGVHRVEVLAASPAAPLASYPLYLAWLLGPEGPASSALTDDGGVEAFFRFLRARADVTPRRAGTWFERILRAAEPRATEATATRATARRLHLVDGTACEPEWGDVFRSYLLAGLLRHHRVAALRGHTIRKGDLARIGRLAFDDETKIRLRRARAREPYEATNLANLHWFISRTSVPRRLLARACHGLRLPGHRFPRGMHGLVLIRSELDRVSLGKPLVENCRLRETSLRDAMLCGVRFADSSLTRVQFDGADLSDCVFWRSDLEDIDLSHCRLERVRFELSTLAGLRIPVAEGSPRVDFSRCEIRSLVLLNATPGVLRFEKCNLVESSLSGLVAAELSAEGSTFAECDLDGFTARCARLEGAVFHDCLLADVTLVGADLRGARLERVSFQPGPGSRSGHTAPHTRWNPLYGSKDGFYSGEVSEGVWGDPDTLRVADLRGADLRGARLSYTDLFRVDLRDAKLDASLREAAARMGAFLDG